MKKCAEYHAIQAKQGAGGERAPGEHLEQRFSGPILKILKNKQKHTAKKIYRETLLSPFERKGAVAMVRRAQDERSAPQRATSLRSIAARVSLTSAIDPLCRISSTKSTSASLRATTMPSTRSRTCPPCRHLQPVLKVSIFLLLMEHCLLHSLSTLMRTS